MFISFAIISWPEKWNAVTPVEISYTGQSHTLITPNSVEKLLQMFSYLYLGTMRHKTSPFFNQSRSTVGECTYPSNQHPLLDLFVFDLLLQADKCQWLTPKFYVGENGEFKASDLIQRRRFSPWPGLPHYSGCLEKLDQRSVPLYVTRRKLKVWRLGRWMNMQHIGLAVHQSLRPSQTCNLRPPFVHLLSTLTLTLT